MGSPAGLIGVASGAIAGSLPGPLPTVPGALANDLNVLVINQSPSTAGNPGVSGEWTLIKSITGGSGPEGLDQTTQKTFVYTAIGNVSVTSITAGSGATTLTMARFIFAGEGTSWNVQTTAMAQNTAASNWSANGDTAVDLEPNDMLLNVRCTNSDTVTVTAATCLNGSATYKTITNGARLVANANGNQHYFAAYYAQCTGGAASATPILTAGLSAAGSGTAISIIIRNSGAQAYTAPYLRSWLQTNAAATYTANNAHIPFYCPGDKLLLIMAVRPSSSALPAGSGGWTKIAEIVTTGMGEAADQGSARIAVYEANPTGYNDIAALAGSVSGASVIMWYYQCYGKPGTATWGTTTAFTAADNDISSTAVSAVFGSVPLNDTDLALFSTVTVTDSSVSNLLPSASGGGSFTTDNVRDVAFSTSTGNDGGLHTLPSDPSASATFTGVQMTGTAPATTSSNIGSVLTVLTISGSPPPVDNGKVKVHTGSVWGAAIPKVWNGSTWVPAKAKVWDGSQWVTTNA